LSGEQSHGEPLTGPDDLEFHYQSGIDLFVADVEGVARRMREQ
jgi:hypothetical protein